MFPSEHREIWTAKIKRKFKKSLEAVKVELKRKKNQIGISFICHTWFEKAMDFFAAGNGGGDVCMCVCACSTRIWIYNL